MAEPYSVDQLPQAWQQRFAFFQAYGLPGSSAQAKAAYQTLPFGKKMRLTSNILAFFFGPIYFFVKGMWRKGLSLSAAALVIGAALVLLDVPGLWSRAIGFGFAGVAMTTANYAYYLHVAKGSLSWNPFEGFGRRSAEA
jgi:Protein of unknown function (DUF2628)